MSEEAATLEREEATRRASTGGEESLAEQQEQTQEVVSGPWMVARIGIDGTFTRHVEGGFKVQIDADNWIKENIGRDERLISLRTGNAFEARFVAKAVEL